MKRKQNMNLQREIKFFSVEEERKFENNNVVSSSYRSFYESVTYLGIHSKKAATLLNEVINWRIRTCAAKAGKEYYDGVDSLKGGGLFVKCNCEVVISSIGKVGLKFKEAYGEYIKRYIRAVSAPAEINKAIKDKIANELKKFWMAYSKYLKEHDGSSNSREPIEMVMMLHMNIVKRIIASCMKFSKDEMWTNLKQNTIR